MPSTYPSIQSGWFNPIQKTESPKPAPKMAPAAAAGQSFPSRADAMPRSTPPPKPIGGSMMKVLAASKGPRDEEDGRRDGARVQVCSKGSYGKEVIRLSSPAPVSRM